MKLFNNISLTILLFLFSPTCISQDAKGVQGDDAASGQLGKTRALIIGISKYQYIESLKFADNDANEFAGFLSNNRFWNIAAEDITILKNDKAKCGDIIGELSRLAQISKPGDRIIFYFSGHGDIETITQFKNGYLLANDTYKNNYITGAIPVSFLKEIFVTLLNKEINIFMFTDACRSGNLAGGLKGTEFAASAISSMWKNEIKILSSQPGQLSYEDEKWGNGRGVFSYYLIKGLQGEADQNKDSVITISELERYAGENVTLATANKQQPIFEGPNKFSTPIGRVYPEVKSNRKAGNAFTFSIRNFIADDSCLIYYDLFNKAIEQNSNDGRFVATKVYRNLKSCKPTDDLLYRANSKLMAALLKQTQAILNKSLEQTNPEDKTIYQTGTVLTEQLLLYNDLRSPYENHIKNIRTYMLVMDNITRIDYEEKTSLVKLDKLIDDAIKREPEAAYLYNAKGLLNIKLNRTQTAIRAFQQALIYSPTWDMPKDNLNKYTNASTQQKGNKAIANEKRLTPGIKAGINYSRIQNERGMQSDFKTGLTAGGFLKINVSSNVAVQPEIIYSEEGGKFINPASGAEQQYLFKYFNLPVLLKYSIIKNFGLYAGPQIGYLSGAKLKDKSGTSDIKTLYSSSNISFVAGLYYNIFKGIGAEGRWVTGLQNINKNKGLPSAKTSNAQLSFFYKF